MRLTPIGLRANVNLLLAIFFRLVGRTSSKSMAARSQVCLKPQQERTLFKMRQAELRFFGTSTQPVRPSAAHLTVYVMYLNLNKQRIIQINATLTRVLCY